MESISSLARYVAYSKQYQDKEECKHHIKFLYSVAASCDNIIRSIMLLNKEEEFNICGIQLLRVLADHYITLIASTLTSSPEVFLRRFWEGGELSHNKMKVDGKWKSMTTKLLKEKVDDRISGIYDECCKFLHPSKRIADRFIIPSDSVVMFDFPYYYKGALSIPKEKEIIMDDVRYIYNAVLAFLKDVEVVKDSLYIEQLTEEELSKLFE